MVNAHLIDYISSHKVRKFTSIITDSKPKHVTFAEFLLYPQKVTKKPCSEKKILGLYWYYCFFPRFVFGCGMPRQIRFHSKNCPLQDLLFPADNLVKFPKAPLVPAIKEEESLKLSPRVYHKVNKIKIGYKISTLEFS